MSVFDKFSKPPFAAVVIAIGMAPSLSFPLKAEENQSAPVATVNGEPITVGFFKLKLDQNRAEVIGYFASKYQADVDSAFWTKDFHGEVPVKILKKTTLAECSKIKLQELLAKEKGIAQDISYESFIGELTRENQRRLDALAKHEVIYGPQQYDLSTYFNYRFSNMLIRLKDKLAEKELASSDQELKAYFDAHKAQYANSTQATVHRIFIPSGPDAKTKIDQIYRALANSHSPEAFDQLAKQWNTDGSVLENTFRRKTYQYYFRSFPELVSQVKKLEEGKVSGIFEGDGGFNIIKCVKKGNPAEFEQIKPGINQKLLDQKYFKLVDNLAKNAKIVINHSAYDGTRWQ